MQPIQHPVPLHEPLSRSRASAEFRDAVERFLRTGAPNDRIAFDTYSSPPVKVARALTMLLVSHPELETERVAIDGVSGCEFYRGELTAHTAGGARRVSFEWNCKWKALEQGWTDHFGYPDQIRAAQEFGYDCFRVWRMESEGRPVPTDQPS
ncbi:MAG TPA: hypothetical protein VFL93_00350 [Longimicrobiaceae bacterium]|jgi:hypothetical protein|nr:hypothetical protein [Longimicrobiaceae bacterium]